MNLPTLISLLRGLLSLFFLSASPLFRTLAIALAALSDFLDGYFARRYKQCTPLGTVVDPLMDKLFVGAALFVFWNEESLALWQVGLFLLRDISLLAFGCYLKVAERFCTWQVRSFISGKLMTALQFIALILLAQNIPVPAVVWAAFGLLGIASFFELVRIEKAHKQTR